jgi:hypothetical protein
MAWRFGRAVRPFNHPLNHPFNRARPPIWPSFGSGRRGPRANRRPFVNRWRTRARAERAEAEAAAERARAAQAEREREEARVRAAAAEGEAKGLREVLGEARQPFWRRWFGL